MPAEDRIWSRYLSFSAFVQNTIPNSVDPIRSGRTGLPEQAPNRPSAARKPVARMQADQTAVQLASIIACIMKT